MSPASIQRAIDREIARREEPRRLVDEAAERSRELGDRFELAKGRRPGYEEEQRGVTTELDIFAAEERAKARAAADREHEKATAERHAAEAEELRQMREERAELTARIRLARPQAPVVFEGARGELRSR